MKRFISCRLLRNHNPSYHENDPNYLNASTSTTTTSNKLPVSSSFVVTPTSTTTTSTPSTPTKITKVFSKAKSARSLRRLSSSGPTCPTTPPRRFQNSNKSNFNNNNKIRNNVNNNNNNNTIDSGDGLHNSCSRTPPEDDELKLLQERRSRMEQRCNDLTCRLEALIRLRRLQHQKPPLPAEGPALPTTTLSSSSRGGPHNNNTNLDQQELGQEIRSLRTDIARYKDKLETIGLEEQDCKMLRFRLEGGSPYFISSIPPMDPQLAKYEKVLLKQQQPQPPLSKRRPRPRLLRRQSDESEAAVEEITPTAAVDTTTDTIAAPAVICNYRLREILGKGANGFVYRATACRCKARIVDSVDANVVAIKVIAKDSLNSWHKVEHLNLEIKALTACADNPNILQLYQAVHGPANIYLITQAATTDAKTYFCQTAAATFRSNGSLRRRCMEQVCHGVLQALQFMHNPAIGFVHLDIKPENILIVRNNNSGECGGGGMGEDSQQQNNKKNLRNNKNKKDGEEPYFELVSADVRLADFGLSMQLQPGDDARDYVKPSIVGTTGYFAPEMLKRTNNPCFKPTMVTNESINWDGRSADMWSLGATLLDFEVGGLPTEWNECYRTALEGNNSVLLSHSLAEMVPFYLTAALRRDNMHPNATPADDLMILDLIFKRLLVTEPRIRPSASQCLHHACFRKFMAAATADLPPCSRHVANLC